MVDCIAICRTIFVSKSDATALDSHRHCRSTGGPMVWESTRKRLLRINGWSDRLESHTTELVGHRAIRGLRFGRDPGDWGRQKGREI